MRYPASACNLRQRCLRAVLAENAVGVLVPDDCMMLDEVSSSCSAAECDERPSILVIRKARSR
jgi:hypothetical protein